MISERETLDALKSHPVVSKEEWRKARIELLKQEKELTKHSDRVAASRRQLPWVKVEKDYVFEGPEGKVSLSDLFAGRDQLIVYHFMFDPEWDVGCSGCTYLVDELGPGFLRHLAEKRTSFVLVSRGPLDKLEAYKEKKGWNLPWYSSFGSDFNYDFHATLDESVVPVEYNYRTKEEMEAREGESYFMKGEQHGNSCFIKVDGEIFHTYSCYARGTDHLVVGPQHLELTALGRQQDWETSPAGWPQDPTYG